MAQTAPAANPSSGSPSKAERDESRTGTAPTATVEEGSAHATPPTKEQCLESHRQSQKAQNEQKLIEAREYARICTSVACPGLLVSDCARWLSDLEQRIPSVVFEVRLNGKRNRSATVYADGKRVDDWDRGEAFRMDPGDHEFRFELENQEPITDSVMLAEGIRFRVVSAEFTTATPTESDATGKPAAREQSFSENHRTRPTPFIVYPLLGLGVLGTASFATFAILGRTKENDLSKSCKHSCTDDQVSTVSNRYLIADISVGVGVASLIAAGVVYLVRAEEESPPTTSVGVVPTPGGVAGFASYRF
jgi:hypothetical protein